MDTKNSRPAVWLDWPPLVRGRLVRRYKRFLADVVLADGTPVTAHCPNSGRMTACNLPGQPVYLSRHDNPRRKLKYTWEIIAMPTSLVGVNTLVPNRLAAEAFASGAIPGFESYTEVHREVAVGANTRLDLKLSGPALDECYVEVKNCTLVDDGAALFPDAPTQRGRKHLETLADLKRDGRRAVIFYLVQRCDADYFAPADAVDEEYGRLLRRVAGQGVEVVVYDVVMDLKKIALGKKLEYRL